MRNYEYLVDATVSEHMDTLHLGMTNNHFLLSNRVPVAISNNILHPTTAQSTFPVCLVHAESTADEAMPPLR